jgi:hypothetical protein
MTNTETINAAVEGSGLRVFENDSDSFSFRQIEGGLAMGTFNFQESVAFIKGWKAAKGIPHTWKPENLTMRVG